MNYKYTASYFQVSLSSNGIIVADAGGQLGWNAMMVDRLLEFDYDLQYELGMV